MLNVVNKMGITIRKAFPEDAYLYADCHISCWQSAYKGIVPDVYLNNMQNEREQRAQKYIKILSESSDCEYYCVFCNEKMVGFLIIHKKDGDIWAIYLIEEFRGKGFGKEILDFAITELKRNGHKIISLWVFEENIRARRFYEKNEFSFQGVKRETDKYGKRLVQLRYTLNNS